MEKMIVLTLVAWPLVQICIRFRTTYESGPDLIGNKLDFCVHTAEKESDLCHIKAKKSDLGHIWLYHECNLNI